MDVTVRPAVIIVTPHVVVVAHLPAVVAVLLDVVHHVEADALPRAEVDVLEVVGLLVVLVVLLVAVHPVVVDVLQDVPHHAVQVVLPVAALLVEADVPAAAQAHVVRPALEVVNRLVLDIAIQPAI